MTRVTTARDGILAQELKPLGLRVPEWRVLATLGQFEAMSATAFDTDWISGLA